MAFHSNVSLIPIFLVFCAIRSHFRTYRLASAHFASLGPRPSRHTSFKLTVMTAKTSLNLTGRHLPVVARGMLSRLDNAKIKFPIHRAEWCCVAHVHTGCLSFVHLIIGYNPTFIDSSHWQKNELASPLSLPIYSGSRPICKGHTINSEQTRHELNWNAVDGPDLDPAIRVYEPCQSTTDSYRFITIHHSSL